MLPSQCLVYYFAGDLADSLVLLRNTTATPPLKFSISNSTFMTTEIILRYLHFISIFAIVGALVGEHLFLKKKMTPEELGRLSRIDAVYGIAALALLGVGLTLWLGGFGKPTDFYSKNWIFHLKLTLFTIVGLLSIYPTVFFLKNRNSKHASVEIPSAIFWMIRLELLLLFIIPLLAGLMAKAIGYFG
jgi:putative membrane protein